MPKFNVGVWTTLYTTICVRADSEDEAIRVAENLCCERESVAADVRDGFACDENNLPQFWDFTLDGIADEYDDTVN